MNYCVFSENEWVYPDSAIGTRKRAEVYAARGADGCFQILTDAVLKTGECVSATLERPGCSVQIYQLLEAHVSENSGVKTHTTTDYEAVKSFVTRKAPFDVYEVTKPLDIGADAGRAVFFVRVDVAADAPAGEGEHVLTVRFGDSVLEIPVLIKVYNVAVPALKDASFHMVNWIYFDTLAKHHNVEPYSDAYMKILRAYLENQLDMRNDYLMIPRGEPVRDADGKVIDFDFSNAIAVGNLALEMGFSCVMGGFPIVWLTWNAPELYLHWDHEIEVTTLEGFRQLKLYFTRANEAIEKNGWRGRYQQCLMDEPQFPNAAAYRTVGAICRKCIPGIVINDPVEASNLGGGLDIWVVKQAVYEKYLEDFKALQAMGEEVWIYTCGFPANKVMNRVIDLPLTVSRLPMWMCYKYGCPGFLHWGYHCHNEEERRDTCYRVRDRKFPAGNAHVVYIGDDRPHYGVRGHSQRTGAQDYELLNLLGARDKEKALALVDKLCRTFDDYDPDAAKFDAVHRELLEALG